MSQQLAIALGVGGQLVTAAVVVAGCTVLLLRLLHWLESEGKAGESDAGAGGGGGKDRPPPWPPDEGGGLEPAWWPQFERQFAEHVGRTRLARVSDRVPRARGGQG
jgi:hypothetical protein